MIDVVKRTFLRLSLCAAALAFVTGCSPSFLVPNPPRERTASADTQDGTAPATTDKIFSIDKDNASSDSPTSDHNNVQGHALPLPDFSGAFDDDLVFDDDPPGFDVIPAFDEIGVYDTVVRDVGAGRYPSFKVRKRPVRVMVRQGIKEIMIMSDTSVRVRTGAVRTSFRGRMQVEAAPGGVMAATVNNVKKELRLPCTLTVVAGGLIKLGQDNYRGAVIVMDDPDVGGALMFVNVLDVEDYLRGVVPLEIGNLKSGDIEAVKAQAVASRTYTYVKMAQRAAQDFDLVSTVSDQVYGGANAEGATPDTAIRLTKDLVMVYGEELVSAYYHSTCGGVTANVEDVWGMQRQPYLRSVKDERLDGSAYCKESSSFTWTETWASAQLVDIIKKYSEDGRLEPPFKGSKLRRLVAQEYFACGRVKKLLVVSNPGEFVTGGDRIRFLLRRDARGNPILRSSLITNITVSDTAVTISGRGHGHGVGMCQTGAIARARAGQDLEKILGAYYTGVSIRTAAD